MLKTLHPRDDVDRLYVSEKEEEDSPDFKIASIYRNNDKKASLKRVEKRLIIDNRNNTDSTKINRTKQPENKNAKKNNRVDILNDKQAKSHKRKLGHG